MQSAPPAHLKTSLYVSAKNLRGRRGSQRPGLAVAGLAGRHLAFPHAPAGRLPVRPNCPYGAAQGRAQRSAAETSKQNVTPT